MLNSNNPTIQSLVTNYSIEKIKYAFPNSRKQILKNVIEITCDCNESDLVDAIAKMSDVFVQPEIGPHYEVLFTPNDLTATFAEDYALDLIRAQDAWDITHGDSTIIIAISDQNFQIEHEDLIGKIHHYDASNTASVAHGTAVAVSAAGRTNNGIGKSSIGFDSELALYMMSYNDILIASYAGSRVINVSWTSGCSFSLYTQNVMDEVYENGSIVVVAAGNGSTCGGAANLVYPAACDHVISVTGIGSADNHEIIQGDTLSTFQHNATVDISAPGIQVALTGGNGYYVTANGTSFAAPIVSGTIALMLAVDTCLTFEDIETILYSTSVDIDYLNPTYAGRLGAGRLDAGAAVLMASTYFSCGASSGDPIVDPVVDAPEGETVAVIDLDSQSLAGINENESSVNDITVYPNPSISGSTITVNSASAIKNCKVLNLNGSMVELAEAIGNKIHIANLAKGAYFLNVNFENGSTKVERIVVF